MTCIWTDPILHGNEKAPELSSELQQRSNKANKASEVNPASIYKSQPRVYTTQSLLPVRHPNMPDVSGLVLTCPWAFSRFANTLSDGTEYAGTARRRQASGAKMGEAHRIFLPTFQWKCVMIIGNLRKMAHGGHCSGNPCYVKHVVLLTYFACS